MVVTPVKELNTSISQAITPVRFLDSPKLKLGTNNTTCKTRLSDILKTLQQNYTKWQLAQKRGLALCTSIEAIKTRTLDGKTTAYPSELKMYCDKLAIISGIFEDITQNAKESLRQTKALAKMTTNPEEIFFRSWKLQHFINFIDLLTRRYEQEANIKQHVMRELPHASDRAALVRWSTAWEYPQHVNSFVDLHFKFLNEELKIEG